MLVVFVVDDVAEVRGFADWTDAHLEVVTEISLDGLEAERYVVLVEEGTSEVVNVCFCRFGWQFVDADEAVVFQAGDSAIHEKTRSRYGQISLCVIILDSHLEWNVFFWDLIASGLEVARPIQLITIDIITKNVFDMLFEIIVVVRGHVDHGELGLNLELNVL